MAVSPSIIAGLVGTSEGPCRRRDGRAYSRVPFQACPLRAKWWWRCVVQLSELQAVLHRQHSADAPGPADRGKRTVATAGFQSSDHARSLTSICDSLSPGVL